MDSQKEEAKAARQEKKKNIRQNQIIDIAEKLFTEKGYENTTMEMIADDSGYTVRSLYLYFNDRDDIFAAVTLRALGQLMEMMKSAIENDKTGYDKLMALARAYFTYFTDYPSYFEFNRIFEIRTYYYHRPVQSEGLGSFVEKCQELNDRITDLLLDVIKSGQKDGTITSAHKSKTLMLILWGATFGILQILRIRRDHLKSAYSTTREELFNDFMKAINKIIKP